MGKQVDPTNTENTTTIVNGYILQALTSYQRRFRYSGTDLKELFQEVFEDWTLDTFALASRACCRDLWRHLLLNRVPVRPAANGISYQKVFMEALQDRKLVDWTLESQIHRETLIKKMENEIPSVTIQQQQQLLQEQQQRQQQLNNQGSNGGPPPPPPPLGPPLGPPPGPPPPGPTWQPQQPPASGYYSKPLRDLLKIYLDKDKKFGGSDYDVLEDKLLIFYNHCRIVGLPQEPSAYAEALSIMLKDQANTYFYTSLYNRGLGFGEMINLLKIKFEIEEKRLMIDIMALRQSYVRRELTEVRWIAGEHNTADAMIKATPNKALETFLDTNKLKVKLEGWVERKS